LKLLFDANLSFRLPRALAGWFPESVHVRDVGLAAADDDAIRRYAAENGLAIVTKDADFAERCLVKGAPPKVVWIRRGNCPTATVESLLRVHREEIDAFSASADPLLPLL
jgi:predicted nuclease of predicted toxin-antitoxin system